jgi:hypothetical protein
VQVSLNPLPPKRSDVMLALWNKAVCLDQAINTVDSNEKNVTPKLKQLIYMAQVYNQLCRTVLYALKDEELTLEVRVTVIDPNQKEHKLLPKSWTYIRDRSFPPSSKTSGNNCFSVTVSGSNPRLFSLAKTSVDRDFEPALLFLCRCIFSFEPSNKELINLLKISLGFFEHND